MAIDTSNNLKPGFNNAGPRDLASNKSTASGSQGSQTATANTQTASEDSVALSSRGQSLNRLEENLANTPDVDSARVDSIKQAIAEGRFEVDAERIAENILNQEDLLG